MEKKELIAEFEAKFAEIKKEMGFKASLKELNSAFYLEDFILKEKYVSSSLSRQVCARMADTLGSWFNFMHSIIMPNPASIVNGTESQAFSDQEKHEILQMMAKIASVTSSNTLNGLSKDKKAEAEFIDKALSFWKKELRPKALEMIKKVNQTWIQKASEEVKEE